MKINVVGAGFVGKATGNGFAKHKHEITFVDVDESRIKTLQGEGWRAIHPNEREKLTGDVTMFCVPTPTVGSSINLEYLLAAVGSFAKLLQRHNKYHVAVIRSTVPPTTTRKIILPLIEKISKKKAGKDFGLAMQPEYLREVSAIEDFERPWMILIGEFDAKSGDILDAIYRPFDAPIEHCGLDEAEFQKYVHNLFNAAKIAFFNEMRIVAKDRKWDADKLFRITAESCEGMWNPIYGIRDYGPFDGSCLPKDTRALLEWADNNGYDLGILRAVIQENIKYEKLLGKNETVRVNYLAGISV